MRRRDVPAALLASAAGALSPGASRADSGAPPYPQTEGEKKANVTPTNLDLPPGNVRRYGAGDGHGADELAFHRACAANDHVYVPSGNYVLNSQVDVNRSNITIVGENPGLPAVNIRLAAAAGRGAAAFRWGAYAADVHIANLGILLRNPGAAQIGLRFAELRHSSITNCHIEGPADKSNDTTAIQFDGTGTFTGGIDVQGCYLNAHKLGVDVQRVCTSLRIHECEIYGNSSEPGTIGVRVAAPSEGLLIAGNTFEGWDTGIYTEGCYVRQIGNYFEANTTHWRWVRGPGRARIWNSSLGDMCLSGGTPVYPSNDVDSCIVFGQSGNFVDTGYLEASRGFREHRRAFNLGEWVDQPFASSSFDASGFMTWSVRPENVVTYAYTIVGKTMTLSWCITGSTIGGRPDKALHIAIPGGFKAARRIRTFAGLVNNGTQSAGAAEVMPGQSHIDIYVSSDGDSKFANGRADLYGQIAFEVA